MPTAAPRRSASSYAFIEGWAHYSKEMMWDAGLRDGDPEARVGRAAWKEFHHTLLSYGGPPLPL